MFFKRQNRSLETADFALIEFALRELNSDATDFVFKHEALEGKLTIVLQGGKVSQILPLVGLPLTSLDVAGTSVTDLNILRDSPLVQLDLSDTKAWEFQCLSNISTLRTLRLLDWRRRDFARLRYIPQLKELVVRKRDYAEAHMALVPLKHRPKLTAR